MHFIKAIYPFVMACNGRNRANLLSELSLSFPHTHIVYVHAMIRNLMSVQYCKNGFFLFILLALSGCVAAPDDTVEVISSEGGHMSSEPMVQADPCIAPIGRSISDIESVVRWINAMPKPLTLPCFVKSLPRPLFYNATNSLFSAQPGLGPNARSPRAFFLIDDLSITVATQEDVDSTGLWDSDGVQLLELSMRVSAPELCNPQSIKAELKFPIFDHLDSSAPYVDLEGCVFCHSDELIVDMIGDQPVRRSEMLRGASHRDVSLAFMLNQYANCDPSYDDNEWYRCDMLDAIFGQGDVIWKAFPDDIDTNINTVSPIPPDCH